MQHWESKLCKNIHKSGYGPFGKSKTTLCQKKSNDAISKINSVSVTSKNYEQALNGYQ